MVGRLGLKHRGKIRGAFWASIPSTLNGDIESASTHPDYDLRIVPSDNEVKRLASVVPIEVSDSNGPTHVNPIHTRFDMGAETKTIQSGGRPLPHVPHYMPDGKVGKPEGLSGSQTERLR